MAQVSRRDFLRMGAVLAAGFGLDRSAGPIFAKGLERIFSRQQRVLWLQGMSCSGCSVSFLNSDEPGPVEILTEIISLGFHPTVSATQGAQAIETVERISAEGKFVLVFEGSVSPEMPEACMFGGKPMTTVLPDLLRKAACVVAVGSCAAFGGIPAAENNPTGAIGLADFMKTVGIPTKNKLVNCPGCPTHPKSIVATLAYLLGKGYPEVDPELLTPKMIYGHSVHDDCPRFHYWQKRIFAERFGDDGCLFKLGCLGPLSHTDCPRRQWNGGVNWCIRAGAPCIACTSPEFARRQTFAFYRKGEQYHAVAYGETDRGGTES